MGKKVGVIGGGQLAWMMAEGAKKLGVKLIIQTPNNLDPAVKIADDVIIAAIADAQGTEKLGNIADVITFENEFIDLSALQKLADRGLIFRPSLAALAPLLDKFDQRQFLQQIGLPVPPFQLLENLLFSLDQRELEVIKERLTFPLVLKARRHGYDGRGTFIISSLEELTTLWQNLKYPSILLEDFIEFEQELAAIAARGVTGEIAIYPIVETQQEKQVCRRVFAPGNVSPQVKAQVMEMAKMILNSLDYVGILGIEFFLTKDGKVIVNEIAPRTHNSGHYTLDACDISQFEMQLRAVTGLELTTPQMKCQQAVMINLLGYEVAQDDYQEKRSKIVAIPHTYLHWYGKTESRPGRKLGHVTILFEGERLGDVERVVEQLESVWYS